MIFLTASLNATSKLSPFEIVHRHVPRFVELSSQLPPPAAEGVRNFVEQARWNVVCAHDNIISQRLHIEYYANQRRRSLPSPYSVGQLVYLSTKNLNIPESQTRKLFPKFIGPFTIKEVKDNSLNVTLDLPPDLIRRRIHPTFHISLIRPHKNSDDNLFPNRSINWALELQDGANGQWVVREIIDHRHSRSKGFEFRVLWALGDRSWETLDNVNELEALDEYLLLRGCQTVQELPKND